MTISDSFHTWKVCEQLARDVGVECEFTGTNFAVKTRKSQWVIAKFDTPEYVFGFLCGLYEANKVWSHPNKDRKNDQIDMLRQAAMQLKKSKSELALGLAGELEQLVSRAEDSMGVDNG